MVHSTHSSPVNSDTLRGVLRLARQEVLPKKKPLTVELQTKINSVGTWINERPEVLSNWATNEWEETKEFQKKSWEQGKDQLARNFQQIKNIFVDKDQN